MAEELLDVEVDVVVDAGRDVEEGRVGVGKTELRGLVGRKMCKITLCWRKDLTYPREQLLQANPDRTVSVLYLICRWR